MTPEKAIQNQILHWLSAQPGFALAVPIYNGAIYDQRKKLYRKPGKFWRKGTSDILGNWRGQALAIETKVPGEKPTKEQIEYLELWKKVGGIALVAFNLTDVLKVLREFDQTKGIKWKNEWMP